MSHFSHSTRSPEEMRALIDRARNGDHDALGELLERHRAYLKLLTQRRLDGQLHGHISGRMAARLDASDIVQQTCLSAFNRIGEFHGQVHGEFAAWLRTIHERNVSNAIRDHVFAQRRTIAREQSLDAAPHGGSQESQTARPDPIDAYSASQFASELAGRSQTSPSQRLMLGEQAVRLAGAMQSLPDDQREAVRLRYLEGRSLADISTVMERTRHSVAGLLKRGLLQLRQQLREE